MTTQNFGRADFGSVDIETLPKHAGMRLGKAKGNSHTNSISLYQSLAYYLLWGRQKQSAQRISASGACKGKIKNVSLKQKL